MSAPEGKVYRNKWPENPGYQLTLEPGTARVVVSFAGEVIASSDRVTILHEQGHGPVYYFPRADLNMALLNRTDHHSHCPYKGHCSYFSIAVGGKTAENAVWSYEEPYPEVAGIKELAAFYPDRVDRIDVG
jgi:uncharacterized protein (DUF427 family)